jgi:hypothetical protein
MFTNTTVRTKNVVETDEIILFSVMKNELIDWSSLGHI